MRKELAFLFLIFPVMLLAQNLSQTEKFDFKKASARIKIEPFSKKLEGRVKYDFEVLTGADTLYVDARNMEFSEVRLNSKKVEFYTDKKGIYIISAFNSSKNNQLELNYAATPSSGMYFINWDLPELSEAKKQVWTQGQGKYTSTWLPSFDDQKEKIEFDLEFEFPADYSLVSNGKLQDSRLINDTVRLWQFDMQKPVSSYLLAVAAGKYKAETRFSKTGKELQLYYLREDSLLVEPTYRYSTRIFDFLEKEIGVLYPWQNYKQVPVKDFLYSGMENVGTTIFSESLMTDGIGFKDRNYVNVNAHELAHQWFGDLVTATNGDHHWLHEGFATYYALLAEKEIFGNDYYYWKLYETAERLKELSDSGKGESLLDKNAGSLTFYQKGAWALHILREKVGDEAFKKGIKNYLNLYAYKNATTNNFIAEMEQASGLDLSPFVKDWLEQSAFKAVQSLESLKKSEFIKNYLNIAALREMPLAQKYPYLEKALDFPVNDYIGQEAVYQLAGIQSPETNRLYKQAFDSNNIFVRQAIASSMENIPESLKSEFESLLNDESYLTQEAALFKLWEQFPDEREKYLKKMKGVDGFYNKNVKMLWLTLNLVTPEFEPELTQNYYEQLSGYTSVQEAFQIRENAFSYLFQLGAFNEQSLESLIKGTQHHTYNFRNYCRQLLTELLKNEEYRQKLEEVSAEMAEKETVYLRSKING